MKDIFLFLLVIGVFSIEDTLIDINRNIMEVKNQLQDKAAADAARLIPVQTDSIAILSPLPCDH